MKRNTKWIYGCMIAALTCGVPGQIGVASEYSSSVYGSIIAPTKPDQPDKPATPIPDETIRPSGIQDQTVVKNGTGIITKTKESGTTTGGDMLEPSTKEGTITYQLYANKKGRMAASLFTQAVSEQKNLEIKVVSVDGLTEYTIRMKYKDMEEDTLAEATEFSFDLETTCKQTDQMKAQYELEETKLICMCGWPKLPGKAYVDIPVTWPEDTTVKEYEYNTDTKKLVLLEEGLVVKEKQVTIAYKAGADIVLSKEAVKPAKTVKNWVDAVKKDEIDPSYSTLVGVLAVLSVLALGGGAAVFHRIRKKKMEGKIKAEQGAESGTEQGEK